MWHAGARTGRVRALPLGGERGGPGRPPAGLSESVLDRRAGGAESGRLAQGLGLVGLLPREVVVLAAEVPVRRGLLEDRPVQAQVLAEGARAQVEVLLDQRQDLGAPDLLGAERLDH